MTSLLNGTMRLSIPACTIRSGRIVKRLLPPCTSFAAGKASELRPTADRITAAQRMRQLADGGARRHADGREHGMAAAAAKGCICGGFGEHAGGIRPKAVDQLLQARHRAGLHKRITEVGARAAGGSIVELTNESAALGSRASGIDKGLDNVGAGEPALRDAAELEAINAEIVVPGTVGPRDFTFVDTGPEAVQRGCDQLVHQLEIIVEPDRGAALKREDKGNIHDSGIQRHGCPAGVADSDGKTESLKFLGGKRGLGQAAVARAHDEARRVAPKMKNGNAVDTGLAAEQLVPCKRVEHVRLRPIVHAVKQKQAGMNILYHGNLFPSLTTGSYLYTLTYSAYLLHVELRHAQPYKKSFSRAVPGKAFFLH
ncbi:hypothetical protein BN871_DE_00110 [Paenibacillus sp. P22]|nr:hypothetical protein BN871_DE_00110 [Paenibacillus sp. P22]